MVQQYSDSYGDKADEKPLAVKVPDSTQNTDENLILDKKPEKNVKGLSGGQKILAGVAIFLVLGAGGGIAANMAFQNHPVAAISSSETSSLPSQTSSSEVSSSATEVLPTVESLEINSSELSDAETFAKFWEEERLSEWINAGATPENAKAALGGADLYATKIASEYDKLYIEALFAPGYESNPSIVGWINSIEMAHKETLANYFLTSFPDIYPEDKVPYTRISKCDNVVSFTKNSNGSVTIVIIGHDEDNADKNRVGKNGNGVKGDEGTQTFVFITDKNNNVKLSDLIWGQ
jgi:hypothetical protein